jgi:hypothetical protein
MERIQVIPRLRHSAQNSLQEISSRLGTAANPEARNDRAIHLIETNS